MALTSHYFSAQIFIYRLVAEVILQGLFLTQSLLSPIKHILILMQHQEWCLAQYVGFIMTSVLKKLQSSPTVLQSILLSLLVESSVYKI